MSYDTLATSEKMTKTTQALKNKGYQVFEVKNGAEALKKIKELIPAGASVMNGSSTTLKEIGYEDYLKSGQHNWRDLHAEVTAENDKTKRHALRRQSVLSDYYLGSVHALVENGEFVIASNSGSQLPHIVGTSPNLIFVVGTQKIVPTLAAALERLENYVIPLEDERMKSTGAPGTNLSKLLFFKDEPQFTGRSVTFILVNEKLGF